mgnify:FL=1
MNKKDVWLVVLIFLAILSVYLFSSFKSLRESPVEGNVVKENKIFEELEKRIGFQGVRDPIDKSKSTFLFRGGTGKTIRGTFNDWNGELYIKDGEIVGIEGKIKTESVDTNVKKINEELKSEKFLNSEKYPEIKFVTLALEDHGDGKRLIGDLTFMGRTQELNFPVNLTENSISADFIMNIEIYPIQDPRAGNEVRIIFKFFK